MGISLINKLSEVPLAFVDVETTGASADFGDRVIEIGITRYEGGKPVAELDQLIDPQRRISPGVVALTGISQEMVTGQPTFDQILPRVTDLLNGAVVVGHNIRFDLSFVHCEYRRARVGFEETFGRGYVLDTLRIARRRLGRGRNGLQILSRNLGIVPPVAHRALADAVTAAKVFEAMMEPVGGWGICLCDAIQQQGGPMGLLPTNPKESLLPLELMEALEQRGLVQMDYVDASEHRTQRIIKPIEVKKRNGELVLVAHCQLRNDRRTFKVERIVQLTKVEEAPAPMKEEQLGLFGEVA